jgi:hypothetical protein
MMKKTFYILWILVFVVLSGASIASAPLATGPAANQVTASPSLPALLPSATPQPGKPEDQASQLEFRALGLAQIKPLQGPLDSVKLDFGLPAEWKLLPGASLELNLTSFLSSVMPAQGDVTLSEVIAGSLSVSLNNVPLQTIILKGNTSQMVSIPIPDVALAPNPLTGQHELVIVWDGGVACNFSMVTSVMIDPASKLILPHQEVPLTLDLASFPRPIYVENLPSPARASLVLPDEPSQSELQAALAVAAGLGRMTQSKLGLDLITLSRLDETIRITNHLIFIGRIAAFDALPTPLHDLVPVTQTGSAEDGVIQIAASPWNPDRVILSVSGGSDQAILKAGQALSSGALVTAARPDLVVVRQVSAPTPAAEFIEDQTFALLGQPEHTFTNFGSSSMLVNFVIPAGITISPEAYMDLVFNHSSLIDYLRSAIVVRLNGIPIGSARLSDTTSVINALRLIIPTSAIRNGTNQLEIQADLFPRSICSDPRLGSLWITVFSNSLLHLPVVEQLMRFGQAQYIGDFPRPFTGNNELSDTTFVLAKNDMAAWEVAGSLAVYLGAHTSGAVSAPAVLWAEALAQKMPADSNLIVVGQPAQMPFLANLADILPAALDAQGELTPVVKAGITFQVSPQADLGYLELGQLAAGETGQGKMLLAILGSSEEGVRLAANALTDAVLLRKLATGNFALLQGRNVMVQYLLPASGGTVPEAGGQPVGSGTPLPAVTAESENVPATFGQPEGWIIPVMGISFVLIILLLAYRLNTGLRKHRR